MKFRILVWSWLGGFVALLVLTGSVVEAFVVGGVMAVLATGVAAAINRE